MYKIKAIGASAFVLGFRLTGIETVEIEQNQLQAYKQLVEDETVGIIITDDHTIQQLPDYFRQEVEAKVKPVTVIVSKQETSNDTLRNKIKKAIGVDVWK